MARAAELRRIARATGTTMDDLGCLLLFTLLFLVLGAAWAIYALVRAYRFIGRAEERLVHLESRLKELELGWRRPAEAPAPAPAAAPSASASPARADGWTARTGEPQPAEAPTHPAAGPATAGEGLPSGPATDRTETPGAPSGVPGGPEEPSAPAASPAAGSRPPSPAPSGSKVPAAVPASASPPAGSLPPPLHHSGRPGEARASSSASPPRAAASGEGQALPPRSPSAGAETPWWHDLEERLGAKLPVWLGAVALALSGAFLVKYSVEQGWLGPEVRVGLAVAFGVALLAGAGLLRRAAGPIAGALAASGVAVLYAAFLAAVHLYQLLTPAGGFALMALTTAVAVGLSLVFGPIVAVIGLVGGFLTPYWIQAGEPDPKRLFAYLLLVHAGVLAVSHRRSWPGLSLASMAGGFLWVFAYLAGAFDPGDGVWLQLFLLAALAGWGAAAVRRRGAGGDAGKGDAGGSPAAENGPVAVGAAAVGALLAFGVITAAESYGVLQWSLVAVLVTGLLVVARLRPQHHLLGWMAGATVSILLLRWAFVLSDAAGTISSEPRRFLWTTALLGVLLAGGAWLALWNWGGGSRARSQGESGTGPGTDPGDAPVAWQRGSWGALCAAVGVVHPVVAWLGWRAAFPEGTPAVSWSLVAVAVAALLAIASVPVARRRHRPGMTPALAALAVAVTALLSWAAALAFDREVLTLAWALEVAALAWLAGRFRLPVLVRLGALLALPVVVRLAFNPWLLEAAAGDPRVFNTLLWTHGLAILAFAAAVVLLDRQDPEGEVGAVAGPVAAGLRWGIVLLLAALVTLEVVHAFHPLDPLAGPASWSAAAPEVGSIAVAWLALGLLLLAAAGRWPWVGSAGRLGSRGLLGLGLLLAILGPCLLFNPAWNDWAVGTTPVFNHLLWMYGLPALLLALAVRVLPDRAASGRGESGSPVRLAADRVLAPAWSLGALLFLFVLVTLEVMQAFRGSDLTQAAASGAEDWALSAAWLLLGMALLGTGIAAGRRFLRAAALAVTGLAVVKVFLFDVARLGDLYRVLSFLGLGLSLLLLAWLYQRFVFRRDGEAPAQAEE